MVTKPSAGAARVLEYLVAHLPAVAAGDPRTYVQYKQVHDALQLAMHGETYGESLQRQGLEDLARWCLANNLPAITGLVVKAESHEPGDGFFRLYGRSSEDYKWWTGEVAASKARDWTKLLAQAVGTSAAEEKAVASPPGSQSRDLKQLHLDTEFNNFLDSFLHSDLWYFSSWLPHYRNAVDQVADSIKSGSLDTAYTLVWKTPDNGVADAGQGVVSFADVDAQSEKLKEQLLRIASDPSPQNFLRESSQMLQWRDQGLFKIHPRLMLARTFAAIAPLVYHTTVDEMRHGIVLRWMERHSSFRAPVTDNWAEKAAALAEFLNKIDRLNFDPLVRNMFPWFVYLHASRGADDRPTFTPGFRERPEQTSAVIAAEIRTVRLRHNSLSRQLYDDLVARHGKDNVGVDQPSGSGGWVDVVLKLPSGIVWLYEIKVASTASSAIREAIGQLLEYGYRGSAWKPERLLIAAEPELDQGSATYLKLLNEKFSLQIEYLQLSPAQP